MKKLPTISRDALVLIIALAAGNVSTYLFHVVMTRLLGPDEYGALGALLGVMLVLGVPVSAIQAVVAKRVAASGGEPGGTLRTGFSLAARCSLILAGAVVAFTPFIMRFLHLGSALPVLLVAIAIVPTMLAPVGRGTLQGQKRFGLLGGGIVAAAMLRFTLGIGLALVGAGLAGAVLAIAVAEAAGAMFALAPFRRSAGSSASAADGRAMLREVASASGTLLAFWLLVTIDVVLARHFLPPAHAGRYAAAALIGRAVLFLPSAVAVLVYPSFVERAGSDASPRLLRRAVAVVLAIGVAVSAGVAVFPDGLRLLFGDGYEVADLALVLAAAMTAFGIVGLMLYHALALGRSAGRLWLALGVEIAAIALVHDSARSVALVVLAVGIGAVALLAPVCLRPVRARRSLDGELWRTADDAIELSVVTPTYNGEGQVAPSLRALTSVLRSAGISYEVILVSDGSTDGTVREARAFAGDGVRLLHYERNQGKGFALRTGLARARGETIAFIDSDGDLDPASLVNFLTLMRMYQADMVIGSKRHILSEVHYPFLRRVMSWTYHKLVRVLFGMRVQDTQTGVKLVRRELLARVLPRLEEKRFAFDLELLAAARRHGYRRILEAPVLLQYRFASTISWRSVLGIVRDTAAIWYRCYVTRRYDPIADVPAEPAVVFGPTPEPATVSA